MEKLNRYFNLFYDEISTNRLNRFLTPFQDALSQRFEDYTHGLLDNWLLTLKSLPVHECKQYDLLNQVKVGNQNSISKHEQEKLKKLLMQLHPWRKGPYHIHGIHIDTEWRSDWKWERLKNHITPLDGRYVLDIGCGNGYHCWRMYGAGAKFVLGIDPSQLFLIQFQTIKHFLGQRPVHLLPLGIEYLPCSMKVFDTVFSMGVFYHRKSPFDHLSQCRELLRDNGQFILETLVVDGDVNSVLIPQDRYACMPNVWFIPSALALESWLYRTGFRQVRIANINTTSEDEQRSTPWMTYHSLNDFLDVDDKTKTVEGYPAPKRVIMVAEC